MPIDVKMGVSGIAQFKTAMGQARDSVKTLDAELKLNEKQFQATGDKETYMANKSKLLQQQIAEQNKVVKEGQNALKAMEKQGVDPASQAYQRMQRDVVNAQAALLDMNGALDTVGQSTEETAQKTDKLTGSLNSINKKVSFDAVLGGIGKITDGMEAAARRVEALARDVWSTIADAAAWGDNQTTLAAMYGIDVERLQAMQKVAANEIQTSVDAIVRSQQKLKNNLTYGTKDVDEAFKKLGVSMKEWGPNGILGNPEWVARNWEDVFWDVGEALKNYGDEVERDAMAQKIFGRGWMELRPMFDAGRQAYEDAVKEQTVVSKENVDKLNELSGTIKNVQQDFETLKNSAFAELAPAFNEVGKSVSELLGKFNEYLQSEEGQEKLGELSEAVTELFSGLSDVDFGTALDSAKGILDGIVGALTWIKDNHTVVEGAIKGIGGAFVALKVAEVLGTLMQGVAALKGLIGKGAAAGGVAASTAASAATGATVTSLISKAFSGAEAFVGALTSKLGLGGLAVLTGVPMIDFFNNPGKYLDAGNDAKKKYDELMSLGNKTIYGPAREVSTPVTQPTGEPKRPRNITGTATEDQMQGYVIERTVESIYDDLYKAINDYDPETNAQDTTQFFDNVLYPLIQEAGKQGGVVGDNLNEIADLIYDKWIQSLYDDEWEGTTGGILNILQEAIDEKAQGLTVQTEPVFPEDAVSKLQETLNTYDLYLRVTPIMGALSALAAGVSGASGGTSKSYTNTSNVYFGNVNVNNGTDLDGMAAKIAEQTKQAMAGFGG